MNNNSNFFKLINKQDTTELNTIESKWADLDPNLTPDSDQVDIEQYQVSPFDF